MGEHKPVIGFMDVVVGWTVCFVVFWFVVGGGHSNLRCILAEKCTMIERLHSVKSRDFDPGFFDANLSRG